MPDRDGKYCPLKLISKSRVEAYCEQGDCAWWCEWLKCCALRAIPSEIEDRSDEIRRAINP